MLAEQAAFFLRCRGPREGEAGNWSLSAPYTVSRFGRDICVKLITVRFHQAASFSAVHQYLRFHRLKLGMYQNDRSWLFSLCWRTRQTFPNRKGGTRRIAVNQVRMLCKRVWSLLYRAELSWAERQLVGNTPSFSSACTGSHIWRSIDNWSVSVKSHQNSVPGQNLVPSCRGVFT